MAEDKKQETDQTIPEVSGEVEHRPTWRPQDADREYFRYETKKRIQHYTVPPQTIFRPAKPTPTIRDDAHKRVAVYARVSTKSKEQVSSIENQTKYYTEKIAKTPNWTMAEIYSDEGIMNAKCVATGMFPPTRRSILRPILEEPDVCAVLNAAKNRGRKK